MSFGKTLILEESVSSNVEFWGKNLRTAAPEGVRKIFDREAVHPRYSWPKRFIFNEIAKSYLNNHTSYHTPAHIVDCLTQMSKYRWEHEVEAAIAILLHDVVYDVRTNDLMNIDESAAYALRDLPVWLQEITFDLELVERFIRATNHDPVTDIEAQQIQDIDMSILAAPPLKYSQYAELIMREFTNVYAFDDYVKGRRQFLNGLWLKAANQDVFHAMPIKDGVELHSKVVTNVMWELEQLGVVC
jgi:predicted metal-dependent HD superfamily phosphohydrolase